MRGSVMTVEALPAFMVLVDGRAWASRDEVRLFTAKRIHTVGNTQVGARLAEGLTVGPPGVIAVRNKGFLAHCDLVIGLGDDFRFKANLGVFTEKFNQHPVGLGFGPRPMALSREPMVFIGGATAVVASPQPFVLAEVNHQERR